MSSSRSSPTAKRSTSASRRAVPTSLITIVTDPLKPMSTPMLNAGAAAPTGEQPRAGGARLLDGKAVAAKVRAEVARRAAEFAQRHGRAPGLAVLQVGQDPASSVYVRNKRRSSLEAGIASFAHDLPASAGEAQILALV